jgi:hypothetical protein
VRASRNETWRLLGVALLTASTILSCGDSGDGPGTPPPDAQPAVEAAAPTTTTVPQMIAWIDESEPEDGKAPLTVKFLSAVKGGVPPYQYTWIFDDDSEPSTEQHPEHTYAESGLYWPELYVTDSRGSEDDDTTVIDVD